MRLCVEIPVIAAAVLVGCAGPPPPAPLPPPRPTAEPIASEPIAAEPAAPSEPEPSSAPALPSPPPGPPPFPPPSFAPPFERTARAEDGVWEPLPQGAAGGTPVLFRSTVHPHPSKPHVYVVVVAIDLQHVDLRLVAGTLEPASTTVPPERRPGLVPAADQADLIAVFNGGFMARHGAFGMRIGSDTFLPPLDDVCTVGLLPDGSVRIGTYLALRPIEPTFAAYRQTPPCLVEGGATNPALRSHELSKPWGAAVGGGREIRRSALGLDGTGRTLFYGLGEEVGAPDLAVAMKAVGAVDAAELDINWSYTRFLFFGREGPGKPLVVTGTLIPKLKHSARGYVDKPSERDFFYLKRRR